MELVMGFTTKEVEVIDRYYGYGASSCDMATMLLRMFGREHAPGSVMAFAGTIGATNRKRSPKVEAEFDALMDSASLSKEKATDRERKAAREYFKTQKPNEMPISYHRMMLGKMLGYEPSFDVVRRLCAENACPPKRLSAADEGFNRPIG